MNKAHLRAYAIAATDLLMLRTELRRRHPIKFYFGRHPISGKRMWRVLGKLWWWRHVTKRGMF